MKIKKETWTVLKDEIKRTLTLLFIFSLLFFFIATCLVAVGVAKGLKGLDMTSDECWNALKVMIPLLIIYVPIWVKILSKMMLKDEQKREKEKNERLQLYEKQYADYITLVCNLAKEFSSEQFAVVEAKEWLLEFGKQLKELHYYRNIEKPNSFIMAACLMYSLIDEETVNNPENVDFAMKCVWKVISEPTTYRNENGEWVEEKHAKANIVLAEEQVQSIKEAFVQDYDANKVSIMQMANMLHLIYLNSCNK